MPADWARVWRALPPTRALTAHRRGPGSGGIAAKEAIISTLGTAYALGEQNPEQAVSLSELLRKDPSWNQGTALALLVFVMLYAPCFVTLVVIRQESGSWKWVGFSLVVNTLLAFVMAVGVYQACQLVQP